MTIVSSLAIYFIMWWLCLFLVLPFGVRTQQEDEEGVIQGTNPSAPAKPLILKKIIATTLLSGLMFLAFALNWEYGWVQLDAMPFLTKDQST